MPTTNEIAMLGAARAAGITSRDELANFMGQLGSESGGLTQLEESFRYTRGLDQVSSKVPSVLRSGHDVAEAARLEALQGRPQELARLMYGGRMGNDDAGDGYLYRGRGFIQLTGEDNYRTYGIALNIDLVRNPDLAANRDSASRIALAYWQTAVPLADRDDVSAATIAINGGSNGLADRHNRFDAWHAVLTPEFIADLDAGRVRPGNGVRPAIRQGAMDDGALRRFETGAEVGQLQTDLLAIGVRDARNRAISINNSYGVSTEQAVRRFQQEHALSITGRAGPDTLTLVRETLQQNQQLNPPRHPVLPQEGQPGLDQADIQHQEQHDRNRERPQVPAEAPPAPQMGPPVRGRPDPRDPEHPDHAMNQGVRDQVRSLYAGHGVALTEQQLDCTTACVMADARRSGMTKVTALEFSEDYTTGKPDLRDNLIAYQGDPNNPATRYSATGTQQAAMTRPEDSYGQFEQTTQDRAQAQNRFLAQQEQVSQNQGTQTLSF